MGFLSKKKSGASTKDGPSEEDRAALKIQESFREHKDRKDGSSSNSKSDKKGNDVAPGKHKNNGKVFITSSRDVLPVKKSASGPGAADEHTVMELFAKTVRQFPNHNALQVKRDGVWQKHTYQEYYDAVTKAARALVHLGFEDGDAVSIIGFNSPEWVIADLAAIAAGGCAAGIYTTNGPEACQYIAHHSESRVAFVEDAEQYAKFKKIRKDLPHLKAIVQWTGAPPAGDEGSYSWEQFMALGDKGSAEEVANRIKKTVAGKPCTYIYTSGTTGKPKGVMLSNDNITWTATRVLEMFDTCETDRMVSFLPLSHIAAQMLDIHGPIYTGACVYFAQPDALKGSLGKTLVEVEPTLFLGVPRVWEKIEARMKDIGASTKGLKKKISTWAKKKGLKGNMARSDGRPLPSMFGLADKLVFSKVKGALGLSKCRACMTGAAPISHETLQYFYSLNIPLFEIYGMSESTGPQTISSINGFKLGSCGQVMPGAECKLDNPDAEGNGEICYRGRHVMQGYLKNDEATAEAIDDEGWLHSGDVGKFDDRGFLYITGRIKELLVTAGGENVAPVPIENELKDRCQGLANAMVVGDRKKYLTVLVSLKTAVDADGAPTNKLEGAALRFGPGQKATTVEEAMKDEVILKAIQEAIDGANSVAISRAQKIQKFKLLPVDFSEAGGELTPTQKLRRRIVVDKYAELIDSLYEE